MADAIAEFGKYLAAITDPSERARAISKAKLLGVQEAPEEAFKAPIKPLGEFLDTPVEVPPVLISAGKDENGQRVMLVRGGIHVTIGRAGKGKTVMNLNRILRWSAGLPMFPGWESADGEPCASILERWRENLRRSFRYASLIGFRSIGDRPRRLEHRRACRRDGW